MATFRWNARRKLFGSLAVLGIVLIVAVVAQFTGRGTRENPYASTATAARAQQPGKRAVFGGEPPPSPTATGPAVSDPAEASTRARTAGAEVDEARASIDAFLSRWEETVRKGDVDGQTALYAPTVARFFRQRNVSNASVRKVKAQMMTLYPTVNHYEISDMKVESQKGSEAVISLRKEWDMSGQKRFAGAERQRLRLRRTGDSWKIISEEETKVYWTKRS